MLSVTVCSLKRVRRSSSCREGEWQTTLPCTDLICVCIFTPYSEEGKTMFSLRVPGSLRTSVTWAFWAFWFSQDSYPFIVFPFSRWQQALDYFQSMLWGWKHSGFQFWNNSAVAWTSISPESKGEHVSSSVPRLLPPPMPPGQPYVNGQSQFPRTSKCLKQIKKRLGVLSHPSL